MMRRCHAESYDAAPRVVGYLKVMAQRRARCWRDGALLTLIDAGVVAAYVVAAGLMTYQES